MEQGASSQTPGYLRFTPGQPLSLWHRCVARLLVHFYYSSLKFMTPNGQRIESVGRQDTNAAASQPSQRSDGRLGIQPTFARRAVSRLGSTAALALSAVNVRGDPSRS